MLKRKRVYPIPQKNKLLVLNPAATRKPKDLNFSLSNTPTSKKTSPWGVLQPYRTEPLFPMTSPRTSQGGSEGWYKNYFLEFAPNVRKLIDEERKRGGVHHPPPNTKEQFLKDFMADHGMSITNVPEKPTSHRVELRNIKPKIWEVREKLRQIVTEHVKSYKKINLEKAKHPVLYRGELDQELKSAQARKSRDDREKKKEERKKIEEARSRMNKGRDTVGTREEEIESRRKLMNLYKGAHNSYHRGMNPMWKPPSRK
jgi:hypothetical protein